jgi:pimeloyl-ACP methyl ester carboxylesterase
MSNTAKVSAPLEDLVYFTDCGSGPPLLLVHGLMITGEMFDPVVARFAKQYRVIVPDLRGHGRSRGLPPPYTAVQLAADLARLLDHLRIDSAAVLGYSQGGAIAQQLALDHPARCSQLLLACTYAFNMVSLREKFEGHVVPLLIHVLGMRRFAKLVISQGLKQLDKERSAWVLGLIADQDRRLMVSAWRQAMVFDSRSRLHEVKCPTLVIAAAADDAVPLHHARMLHEGIAGSQLAIVDGANHALIWTDPNSLAQLVEKFLALGS